MNTTTYPATVRELGDMAEARGVTVTEMLDILGPIPTPPAGFVEAPDAMYPEESAGYFDGPTESGDGWQIDTMFTYERGVFFEIFQPNGDRLGGMTPAQAIAAGTALAALATKYAVTA